MSDTLLFEKAIKWAKGRGFQSIKANTDDYETPTSYSKSGIDETIVPDITGLQMGGKSYIEICSKDQDQALMISKWQLLSTMATMKGGRFFLLAPRGCKSFAEKMTKKHNIEANIVSI